MDAAAVAWLGRVTAVRQAAGVAVVADAEDLCEGAGRDDAADLEAGARRPLGELLGHAHVDLFEGYAVGHWLGLLGWIWSSHFGQVNTLVYTHFPDYNAQHVAARTVVRAPTGMCPRRRRRRCAPR